MGKKVDDDSAAVEVASPFPPARVVVADDFAVLATPVLLDLRVVASAVDDSLVVDPLVVDALAVDSLAVDSLAVDSVVVDSLLGPEVELLVDRVVLGAAVVTGVGVAVG